VTHLSVNLNKVALLRNQRPLDIPDVQRMALIAMASPCIPGPTSDTFVRATCANSGDC
jgi:hypothetical protein